MTYPIFRTGRLLLAVVVSISSAGLGIEVAAADNAAVKWNSVAADAFLPSQGTDPLNQSRAFAMLHAAIHDALNAIDRRYESYTPGLSPATNASANAAVAAAARDVLLALVPGQQPLVEAAYAAALGAIPDGPAKSRGLLLGRTAAVLILERRADDGAAEAFAVPYIPTGVPGDYTFTPPFDEPPLGPLAFAPGWGDVTPFGIVLKRHKLPGPTPIKSAAYAFDLGFLKAIGEDDSSLRTAEQSEIALFWYEDSPIGWNRIARRVLSDEDVGLWDSARILALANFAMADGYIAGFDVKYDFRFWRPVTAIRAAGSDGNRFTHPDRSWTPFLITPPVPDYPSTHTVVGTAAAQVLLHFLGDEVAYATSSVTAPGVVREFESFSEAALENGASRIYGGIHFVKAVTDGHKQGKSIGRATARLLPAVH